MSVRGLIVSQQIVQTRMLFCQLAGSHYGGVLRLQGTRGRIAWIGKQRLFACLAFLVQPFEALPRHQYLPSDFKRGRIVTVKHQRDGAYGLYIVRHVISLLAVSAGDGPHQLPLFISQRDGGAVVFQFAAYFKILIQSLPHSFKEVGDFAFRVGVTQGEHGVFVGHLREVLVKVAAYAHGRRVGVCIFGMLIFKLLQLSHQVVKLLVGNFGRIQHIVVMVMSMQF